jgi:hypothetical protein
MCNPKQASTFCSKLSDYDSLCGRISERHRLKGFYRAFMSTSTQWLSNMFAGICVSAKIVNMHVCSSLKSFISSSKLFILFLGTNFIRYSRRYV